MTKRPRRLNRNEARRLVEALSEARAVDIAYIARSQAQLPPQELRHPEEIFTVGVEPLCQRRAAPVPRANRIARLHQILAQFGLAAHSSNQSPTAPARFGALRLYRAETDRRHQGRGTYLGPNRSPEARGQYFSASPIVATEFGQPKFAPLGAQQLYVDLPRAVADQFRADRPEVLENLSSQHARLPQRNEPNRLPTPEFVLDAEWAGRAMPCGLVTEQTRKGSGVSTAEGQDWTFGTELLVADDDSQPVFVTLHYVRPVANTVKGATIPNAWTNHPYGGVRHYGTVEVSIPLQRDYVLHLRCGPSVDNIEFLRHVAQGTSEPTAKRFNLQTIENALLEVDHLLIDETAEALTEARDSAALPIDIAHIGIPRSEILGIAHVLVSHGARPNETSVGWSDVASVARRLMCTNSPVAVQCQALGSVVIHVLSQEQFNELSEQAVTVPLVAGIASGGSRRLPLGRGGKPKPPTKTSTRTRPLHRRTA